MYYIIICVMLFYIMYDIYFIYYISSDLCMLTRCSGKFAAAGSQRPPVKYASRQYPGKTEHFYKSFIKLSLKPFCLNSLLHFLAFACYCEAECLYEHSMGMYQPEQ